MVIDTLSIEYFLEVARYLNFTKAANALYVSQPAISRKVAALEKELGCPLIDRTSKSVVLTPAGKAFQEYFTRMMSELDEMVYKVKEMSNEKSGKVSLGVFQEWDFSEQFRPMLMQFRKEYSNIALNIDTNLEKNLFRGLKHGQYDVIFGMRAQIDNAIRQGYLKHVQVFDLVRVQKLLLYSSYNVLADKDDLKPEDFRHQTLYTFADEEGPVGLGRNIRLMDKRYGFKPQYHLVSSLDAIFVALSTGDGYAIVDDMVRAKHNKDFSYMPLDDYNTVSLAVLEANDNVNCSLFMNYCLTFFASDKNTGKIE